MINELIKLATHLDKRGLTEETDYVDAIIRQQLPATQEWKFEPETPLGRALMNCSLRETFENITCVGWKDLERKATVQSPGASIKTNCPCEETAEETAVA